MGSPFGGDGTETKNTPPSIQQPPWRTLTPQQQFLLGKMEECFDLPKRILRVVLSIFWGVKCLSRPSGCRPLSGFLVRKNESTQLQSNQVECVRCVLFQDGNVAAFGFRQPSNFRFPFKWRPINFARSPPHWNHGFSWGNFSLKIK